MKLAAFIGTGNMGGALVRAACRSVGADQVVIVNRSPEKSAVLAAETGCAVAESNGDAARQAQYVFLGVKPQMCAAVLADLGSALEGRILVSMAAGLQTDTLQSMAGADLPVLRIMPNTPAAIGRGMIALCAAHGVAEVHLAAVERILRASGRMERIPEGQMDAFSAVAGCGPAFVYQFIEALADGGVMAGLPRKQAQIYAAQTLLGAAAMVLETGEHPGALKDAVCSPGGSTIAGVAALEKRAFRAAAIEAVQAAFEKNTALGRRTVPHEKPQRSASDGEAALPLPRQE